MTISQSAPCVYLLDDDRSVLKALARLVSSAGYEVRAFDSSSDFLREHDPDIAGCAILDVIMEGLDGLKVQEWLDTHDAQRKVIFLSSHDDAATGVRAMKAGAIDYLTKPAQDSAVLNAVSRAIAQDEKARRDRTATRALQQLFTRLTPRERNVFQLVLRGRLNKQIAFELGIVEKTVKVHRSRVMRKLEVGSFAQLLWAGRRLGAVDESGLDLTGWQQTSRSLSSNAGSLYMKG